MKRLFAVVVLATMLIGTNLYAQGAAPFSSKWSKVKSGVASDSTNVTTSLRAKLALAAAGNGYLRLDSGVYLLTDSIVIPSGVTLEGVGSNTKLFFTLGTNEKAVCMSSYSTLKNVRIVADTANGATFSDGSMGTCITIGQYNTGAGYHHVVIENVDLDAHMASGNSVFITGASHDITINGVHIRSNASTVCGINVHWGRADTTLWGAAGDTVTYHPYNINVSNVTIDSLTHAGSRAGFISGAYNITYENFDVDYVRRSIRIIPGDWGFYFADTALYDTAAMEGSGIVLRNWTTKHDSISIWIDGKAELAPDTPFYNLPVTIENFNGKNKWATANKAKAIHLAHCKGVTIRNSQWSGYTYGISAAAYVEDLIIEGCTFRDMQNDGLLFSYSSVGKPDRIMLKDNRIFNVGRSGTDASGIKADYCKTIWMHNNTIGAKTGDSLNFGIYIGANFADSLRAFLVGNTVLGWRAKSTAGGYRCDDTPQVFLGNTVLPDTAYRSSSSGLALSAWPIISDSGKVPSDTRWKNRSGTEAGTVSLQTTSPLTIGPDSVSRGRLQVSHTADLTIDSSKINPDSVLTLVLFQESTDSGSGPVIGFVSGATGTAWGYIHAVRYGADSLGFDFYTEEDGTARRVLRILPDGSMYKVSLAADSAYATKGYADAASAGLTDSSVTAIKLATAVHNLFLKNAALRDSIDAIPKDADSIGGFQVNLTGLTNQKVMVFNNAQQAWVEDSLDIIDLQLTGSTGQVIYNNGSVWATTAIKVSDSASLFGGLLKKVSDTMMWIDGTDTARFYFNASSEFIIDGPGSGPSYADSTGAIDTANATFQAYITNHAVAGSGSEDSVFINDGSTQYSNIDNLYKIKEGTGIDIQREDSTSYDVFKFAATLGTTIEGSEITNQTIAGDDVDSTAENFVFSGAYHITSAVADSAFITANTLNDTGNILRAEMLDSAAVRAGDTATVLRADYVTAVTAGNGIHGGATSGTATVGVNPGAFIDTIADNVALDTSTLGGWIGDSVSSKWTTSNTEDGITVVYQTSDNTWDFTVTPGSGALADTFATRIPRGEVRDTVNAIVKAKGFFIESPTVDDDVALWSLPYAITVDSVIAFVVGGTNVVGQLQECNNVGAAGADVQAADMTITTSRTANGTFSNAAMDATDWMGWKTTSVSGPVTRLHVTVYYHE